jgi:hypothetical protein
MVVRDPPDDRAQALLPIVRYAVGRKRNPDYWDYASLVELSVVGSDARGVRDSLGKALVALREPWEAKTTVRNLSLIRRSRAKRGERFAEGDDAERRLRTKAGLGEALD